MVRHLVRFKPENVLLSCLVVLLVVIRSIYGGGFTPDKLTAKAPLIAMGAILLLTLAPRARALLDAKNGARAKAWREARTMLWDWMPFILCTVVYENLHDTVKLVRPGALDGMLGWMDQEIFGVQPTLWLEQFLNPWFTDYMAFAYGTYFFTPTIIAGLLYLGHERVEFRQFMFAAVTTLSLGFVGYMIVPAVGPRYYISALYQHELTGVFLYKGTAALMNNLQAVNRDCFPSLHTGMSTITLIYTWRLRDKLPKGNLIFAIYLPLTVSLWLSTVYLRYHWVVDVFAGWALAALVGVLIPVVSGWWNERRKAIGLRPLGH